MLLPGLLALRLSWFLPRTGTTHSGPDPPTAAGDHENAPQACSQANLIEAKPN